MVEALVLWITLVFMPDTPAPVLVAFKDEGACKAAVQAVRAEKVPATDCVSVKVPKPKTGDV